MKLLTTTLLINCLFLLGCAQMTPQQVQTVAAVTAATVAIAGTTAQAFPNKHISPQQVQAITAAAVQTAQMVGQAASTWTTPTPSPTPTSSVAPH